MYSSYRGGRGERRAAFPRNRGGYHGAVRHLRHAGDFPPAGGHPLSVTCDLAGVSDRPTRQLTDANGHVELLLESQRPMVFARCRDARPSDGRGRVVDTQASFAPERVFRILEVAEEI